MTKRQRLIEACAWAIRQVNNDTVYKGIDKDLFEAVSHLEQEIENINEE